MGRARSRSSARWRSPAGTSVGRVDVDLHPELAACERDRVAERGERLAAAGVEAVDRRAPAPQQLDQAEVLVVAPVAHVDELRVEPVATEQLAEQVLRPRGLDDVAAVVRGPEPAHPLPLVDVARVRDPDAEPDVGQRHQEGERAAGLLAHRRRQRGARHGHRRGQRDVAAAVRRRAPSRTPTCARRRRAGRRSPSSLNVKLVTPRPGGVAPGSETLAAAHTISVGQSPFTPVSESGTSRSNLTLGRPRGARARRAPA